jgi:hypothetical protein
MTMTEADFFFPVVESFTGHGENWMSKVVSSVSPLVAL